MANLTPSPPVAADARSRATRTLVQGLVVAVLVDVSRVAFDLLSSSDPVAWSVLGYAVLRAALLALVAYVMRLQLPPPDDVALDAEARARGRREPGGLRRAVVALLAPLVAIYRLAVRGFELIRWDNPVARRCSAVLARRRDRRRRLVTDANPFTPADLYERLRSLDGLPIVLPPAAVAALSQRFGLPPTDVLRMPTA